MAFTPQIAENNRYHSIIFLPEYFYKSKLVRWYSYYVLISGLFYISLVSYYLLKRNVNEQDVTIGALDVQIILLWFSLNDEETMLEELELMRKEYFWSLAATRTSEMKIYTYLTTLLWVFMLIIVVGLHIYGNHPKIVVYNFTIFEYTICKVLFYLHVMGAYFIGNAHLCFYCHVIIHGYLQIEVLTAYLQKELGRFKTMTFEEKIVSIRYQSTIEAALLRSIQHHQMLNLYGTKVASMYKKWMKWNILAGVLAMALGIRLSSISGAYDFPLILLLSGIAHFSLCCLLYMLAGQLFAEVSDDFRNTLVNVNWSGFNNRNQWLYLMFLTFAEMKLSIEVLPGLFLDRAAVAKFAKSIYVCITLLQTLQDI